MVETTVPSRTGRCLLVAMMDVVVLMVALGLPPRPASMPQRPRLTRSPPKVCEVGGTVQTRLRTLPTQTSWRSPHTRESTISATRTPSPSPTFLTTRVPPPSHSPLARRGRQGTDSGALDRSRSRCGRKALGRVPSPDRVAGGACRRRRCTRSTRSACLTPRRAPAQQHLGRIGIDHVIFRDTTLGSAVATDVLPLELTRCVCVSVD